MSSKLLSSIVPGAMLVRPVIALNLWTLFMEGWLYATRIPAINRYKINLTPTATKADLNARIPPHVQWKADNFNHLLEQPTQFYAIALALAFLGADDGMNVRLAWMYVGLRVAHSLVQATVNNIMVRFSLFAASSFVLLGMTVNAVMLVV